MLALGASVAIAAASTIGFVGGTTTAAGHVEPVVAFDPAMGELPEGVAVDRKGNVFVSLSPLGQVVKVPAGSTEPEPFGSVPVAPGDFGVLGLATDATGNVYGAVLSDLPGSTGVWKFDRKTGDATRVAGTEQIVFPNSVAFDHRGTMYVTDTILGAVWRVPRGGSAEPWIQDETLTGTGLFGFGFPIGANGIDVNGDAVLVAVTERAHVVRIPIEADGSAGEAALFADLTTIGPEGGPALLDGLATGNDGEIYVTALNLHSVFEIDAGGTDITAVATADDGLDAPSSVEVTADGSLYIASFSAAIEAVTNGQGSSIIKIPG